MAKKTAKKAPAKKSVAANKGNGKKVRPDLSRSPAMKGLIVQAQDIHGEIKGGRRPSLRVPIRSLSNVTFSLRKGFFTIGKKVSPLPRQYE
jgi:DNA topoisomerase VI subunit A